MGLQEHGRIDCEVELPDRTLLYSLRPKAIDTPFVESLTGYVRRLATALLIVLAKIPNCLAISLRLGMGFFVKAFSRAFRTSIRRLFLNLNSSDWYSSNSRIICGEEATGNAVNHRLDADCQSPGCRQGVAPRAQIA